MKDSHYWEELRSQLQFGDLSSSRNDAGNVSEDEMARSFVQLKEEENQILSNTSLEEVVASELMAVVFDYLSMEEIMQCSLVNQGFLRISRCDAVWRVRLLLRWNLTNEELNLAEDNAYYEAYRRAHDNPHDLWLTHWDIVYPSHGMQQSRSISSCKETSIPAFAKAATFHRTLQCQQYSGCITQNLTDLLFFNLTDPASSRGQWELSQLAQETMLSDAARAYDTTHHSWHVVKFRNVDRYRTIFIQIGIQRPECFTVYPSEGYIGPGDYMFVTFGVTSFGASLAYAFESLNAFRDSAPVEWSERYTDEAHLPLCPFIIRYHFVPSPPLRQKARRGSFSSQTSKRRNVPAHQTRVIRLSAHVNAHYDYEQFHDMTKQPFSYYLHPEAWEKDGDFCEKLQTILQDQSKWVLTMKENSLRTQTSPSSSLCQRRIRLENLCRLVGALCDGSVHGTSSNLSILLYVAHTMIKSFLASPYTSEELIHTLSCMDIILDASYKGIPCGGEAWVPWRVSGCYRYVLSTDSVFRKHRTLEAISVEEGVEWKDEPHYLETFRYLTHSPGRFCLGPQEDINHLGETVTESPYHRSQVGNVTDVFMNDPVFAFQAGICMISDPPSLSVHGIYDWIPYPGTVVRRPRFSTEVAEGLSECPLVPSRSNIRWFFESTITSTSLPPFSLYCYLNGMPFTGQGDLLFSYLNNNEVVPFVFDDDEGLFDGSNISQPSVHSSDANDVDANVREIIQGAGDEQPRPHRLLELLGMIGARVGLAISDEESHSPVYVERTILIASQWVSVSFMAAPLFITLVGRHWHWIPTDPVHYMLHYDQVTQNKEMRFLDDSECGIVAAIMFVFWLALARWTERYTCRDFFRVLQEHTTVKTKDTPSWKLFCNRLLLRYQKRWDSICPLFLQRKLYTPEWNKRSVSDLRRHIGHVRSRHLPLRSARASTFTPSDTGIFGDERDCGLETETSVSSSHKVFIGIVVALGSFCSTTPHFWLNLVTIFSCSISMGMSVSLHSIEKGRSGDTSTTGSMLETFSVVTVVILAFLIGQLVGSSGGTMFLCEFVVTSVSLLLGGGTAGTISASAIESWCSFFILSSAGFWGYLFGRVALLDGIRQRRGSHSTLLLSNAVGFLALFWVLLFLFAKWATPTHLVVVDPSFLFAEDVDESVRRYRMGRKLQ